MVSFISYFYQRNNKTSHILLLQEVVERFGRFPKRNAALGRQNTPEEEELLKNYPYTF